MNNQGLLTIIAVVLIGIFAVVIIQATEKSPSEKVADSISSVADQVSYKIGEKG